MAVTATRKTLAPQKYSFKQIEELWVGAGGPLAEAPLAASVALAESGGNPNAENHNTNGSVDRGLFQINSVHGSLSTTDIAANVRAAVKINKESGWSPWVTYKTGAYKQYYQSASIPLEKGAEPQAGILGVLQGKVPGFSSESGAETTAEKALESINPFKFSWSSLSEFAVKAILLLAGAVLIVYGIMVAVRPRASAFSVPKPVVV